MSRFYTSNRSGLSHWDPYVVHRGSSQELYHCNMVEWFWWDSGLVRVVIISQRAAADELLMLSDD